MTIVIKAARIFDGKSGGLLRNSSVVVEGDRIACLTPTARAPSGAESIDLGDVTLSPGFIDAHTHLTVAAEAYDQFFINQFRQHVAERAYLAALNARVTLEAGFTTVRDVGCIPGSNFVDVSLRNAIAKKLVPGPRMLVAQPDWGNRRSLRLHRRLKLPRYRPRVGLYRRGRRWPFCFAPGGAIQRQTRRGPNQVLRVRRGSLLG